MVPIWRLRVTFLQDGSIFAGRFRVIGPIANGGMGAVYEVVHLETERRRALKVMHPHVIHSDDLRERFKLEAKVAARIKSEFVVDVVDASVDEATGVPYLVMELLQGEELGKRLKRVGRLSPGEVVMYLGQTARALEKSHRAAIVHRDLKPANLFVAEREEGPPIIKVLDFGIAKLVADGASAAATQSIGTPLYMAPEQFRVAAGVSAATDIFALGMVAYTLLVGAPYWAEEQAAGNSFAMMAAAMFGPKEPASARAGRRGVFLPPMFDWWFAKITAADPGDRFAGAAEAVSMLAEALGVARKEGSPSLSGDSSVSLVGLRAPLSNQGEPVTLRVDSERAAAMEAEARLRGKAEGISPLAGGTQPTDVGSAVTQEAVKKPTNRAAVGLIAALAFGSVTAGGVVAFRFAATPNAQSNGDQASALELAEDTQAPVVISAPPPEAAPTSDPAERLIELPDEPEPSPPSDGQAAAAPSADVQKEPEEPFQEAPPEKSAVPLQAAAEVELGLPTAKGAVPPTSSGASGVMKVPRPSTSSSSVPASKKWIEGPRE
jgi:serine/threonine-protein kinase